MRGKDNIVKWMVENPNKKLECKTLDYVIWYDGVLNFRFEYKNGRVPTIGGSSGILVNSGVLESNEWTEIIYPISFREAYDDCKENGTEYYENDEYGRNRMFLNDENNVEIEWAKEAFSGFDFKDDWVKKEHVDSL